jgi:hypothetical protein
VEVKVGVGVEARSRIEFVVGVKVGVGEVAEIIGRVGVVPGVK